MVSYSGSWIDRVGGVAAATYTPAQGEPLYGPALDIGTAPLTPGQFEAATNAIQTVAQDEYEAQAAAQALTPAEADFMEQAREQQAELEDIERRIEQLQAEGEEGDSGVVTGIAAGLDILFGGGGQGDVVRSELNELVKRRRELKAQLSGQGSSRWSQAWNALSGVDSETGLNRTERGWLQAQANQDSNIEGILGLDIAQHDAAVFPELRADAAEALRTGQWSEDLLAAYGKYQQLDPSNYAYERTLKPLEEIASQGKRGISTFGQVAGSTLDVTDPDFEALVSAETWRDAWERSEHVSIGQQAVDRWALPEEELEQAYEAGFDEFGNPLDQAYYNTREGAAYNVTTGTMDFAASWYLDPLVIGGKALGAGRAIAKADWQNMPRGVRARMQHIATTPADRWGEVKASIGKHDIIGQRAVKVREQMDDLTTKVRSDPAKHDEVWMADNVPAFRANPDSLLAAGLWRESARWTKKRFDAPSGTWVDETDDAGNVVFDDEVHDLARAALMGNGKAVAQLAEKAELNDYLIAATRDHLDGLDDMTRRMELREEDLLTDPNLTNFQRYDRLFHTRVSLAHAEQKGQEHLGRLDRYDSFHTFTNAVLDSADATALRQGVFKSKPRRTDIITKHSFRPTVASDVAATVTKVPRMPWLKRSHTVDLSGHGSLQEQAPRYLDELAKAADIDTLHNYATVKGFESWDQMRRGLLNRSARARTDVERRQAIQYIEDTAIEAVALKHGLTVDEATRMGMQIKGRRGELIANAKKQAEQAKAQGLTDENTFRYVYAEGNTVHNIDMPLSVTQLDNYHIPLGVRELDRFLRQHKSALKPLYQLKDAGTEGLELFNAFWKPMVLFRLGYPARTVSEELLRIVAHTGSWMAMVDAGQATGRGIVNQVGVRGTNFALRNFPTIQKYRGTQLEYLDQTGRSAKEIEIGGRSFSNSFAPGDGDIAFALNSSGDSMDRLFRTHKGILNKLHREQMKLHKTLEGEPGHPQAWAHVLNNRIAYDPIWIRMLNGQTDDEIVDWLRRSGDGREVARRNPRRGNDPDRWVDEMRTEFEELTANDEVLKAKLLNRETITVDELQQRMDAGTNSPVAIDESVLELVQGKGALADTLNGFVDKGYHMLAAVPTDTLARNPFFNRQYRAALRRQVDDLPEGMELSAKAQKSMETRARNEALKNVRRYLFNLSEESDLTHYMRFLAPFMGAWQESMRAWARIFTEKPEAFQRMVVNGWMSMDDLYFVEMTDQNGRTADDPDHEELNTAVVSLPKGMVKSIDFLVPGDLSGALDTLAPGSGLVRMPINKATLNTTLQGDPFWLPGLGPLAQLAGSYALRDKPEFADQNKLSAFLWKYLFPIGVPTDPADAVKSTLWRRVDRQIQGLEDPVFTNASTFIYKSMMYQWEQGGRVGPRPSHREAVERGDAIQALYTAGALASPFSFSLEADTQFFVDKAYQYKDQYGFQEGFTKYIQDFGEEAYYFWYSNSQTAGGVPPTSAGYRQYKKRRALVEDNPDIGLAIVGMDTQDETFSYDVYARQRNIGQRTTLPPDEAVAKAEASQGWSEYHKLSEAIRAELEARGLTSLNQTAAQDLAYLKRTAIVQLRERFPGWSRDYDQFDKGRSYEIVGQFRNVLQSGKTPETPAWEGAAQFVDLWDTIAVELDARRQAGGSPNIEVADNADLKMLFDKAVGQLEAENLAFAEIYYRFLENASLTDGSHGQPQGE